VRVLVLTARNSEADFLRGWRRGIDHYATKPFDPDDLLKAVQDVLLAPATFLHSSREEELERSRTLPLVEMAFRHLPEA
jgi:DNA-binding response OmpR family regulator